MTRTWIAAALVAASSFSFTAVAQQEGPTPTQALVTVESKTDAVLTVDQVTARVNNHETPLTSLQPVPANGLQVALLIDDGLRTSAGRQLNDLRSFVQKLRPGTEIFVGYMQNGRVVSAQLGFSTNYAEVARQIRLPLGARGLSASPYFCLTDFLKRWPGATEASDDGPARGGKARIVLMLTNGVDPYNGSDSPLNQNSPYVQEAATAAQRAGVPVYSIYYGDAGMRGNLAAFSGQSYLQQVAGATGGQSFYQGTWSPVSLAPFLDQFRHALAETYVASFPAVARDSKTMVTLKLSTKASKTKLYAPTEIHPGATFAMGGPGGTAMSGTMMR